MYEIIIFVFGLCMGSFLNVVVLRMPLGISLKGRSKCNFCKNTLSGWELIPLFSYLFLKGKCKNCHRVISGRYFLIELIVGFLFLWTWLEFLPQNIEQLIYFIEILFFIWFLVCIFIIDFEHYLILDKIVFSFLTTFVFITIFKYLFFDLSSSELFFRILSALLSPALFFLIWVFSKGRLIGFGDVKLMLVLGWVLGIKLAFLAIFLAVIFGSVVGIILMIFNKGSFKTKLPFGCFLSIGAFVSLFYGDILILKYLFLLGL